jgi:gamma-glutamylcysteine synthetase
MSAGGFALHTAVTKGTMEAMKDSVSAYKILLEATNARLDSVSKELTSQNIENAVRDGRLEDLEEQLRIRNRKIEFKEEETKIFEDTLSLVAQSLKSPIKEQFDSALKTLDDKRRSFKTEMEIYERTRKVFHAPIRGTLLAMESNREHAQIIS